MKNNLIILTDNTQTGKTTLLQQFCKQQNDVSGILTPIVNGKRVFYNIAKKIFFKMEADVDEATIAIGRYLFSVAAFAKASNIVLYESKKKGTHYLVLDEIGPMEVKQYLGFYKVVTKILSSDFTYTFIIVIRQSLISEAIQTLQLKNAIIFNPAQLKAYFNIK